MVQKRMLDGDKSPHRAGSGPVSRLSPAADLVRREDRDRFVLALMAPQDRREALFALFAHAIEAARVPGLVSEPMLGLMRLQYWRDLIDAEDPMGAARGNPVGEALVRDGLPMLGGRGRALLHEALQAHADDLPPDPPPDAAAMHRMASGTTGAITEAAVVVLGATDGVSRQAARHVGTAWGLLEVARSTPRQIRQGRLRLPLDAVTAVGSTAAAILGGEDKDRAGIRAGVGAVLDLARGELTAARDIRRSAARGARPVLRLMIQADHVANAIRRAGADPFDGRVAMVRPPMIRLLVAHLLSR